MKDIIVKLLLIAVALAAITFFVGSESGLWGDAKTVRDRSDSQVEANLVPWP
ncbi:hypothetical protein [Gorillibacterium massiliense]|uniref:hypothetical protein n=1 Tax=Gorillibacterium massiliense TaxID=1280390 RepID=UPI0004B07B7E|nr:hypothetical protein [Gorillibacterium massiliense]